MSTMVRPMTSLSSLASLQAKRGRWRAKSRRRGPFYRDKAPSVCSLSLAATSPATAFGLAREERQYIPIHTE